MKAPHLLVVTPDRATAHATHAIIAAAASVGAVVTVASYLSRAEIGEHTNVVDVLCLNTGDDTAAFAAFVDAAREVHRRHPVMRAVSFAEPYVESVAEFNHALALGGTHPDTARRCRDKSLMRRALAEAGVPIPRYWPVSSFAEFCAAVREAGFPCVSKPARGTASDGVVRLNNIADVMPAYEFTRSTIERGDGEPHVLVEEYVSGQEFSVEGIVSGSRAMVAGVTQKTTEDEPFFNEVMHVHPAPLTVEGVAAFDDLAGAAVRALGLTDGGFHLEARLTARGPVVMECAARLGGDSIPILVQLSSGIDLYATVLRQVLGLDCALHRTRNRTAGIRFVQTPDTGWVRSASLNERVIHATPGVLGGAVLCAPGTRLGRAPQGDATRIGFVIARGASVAEVERSLVAAEHAFDVDIEYSTSAPQTRRTPPLVVV